MSNILIEASNITKIYDPDIYLKRGKNFYALNNVSFILEKGDFISVMGPSGSGKSTLLNCISTLDKISSGSLLIKGRHVMNLNHDELCDFRYQSLGFIFQDHNLIPYLSISDNIASPALLGNQNPTEIKQKILHLAKELEIESILDKFPEECSGGECQRAAIARALINEPEIIFCDEPTGNLDSKNSRKVLEILSSLHQKGTSILLVTHDPLIASYSQKMMYLFDGGIQTVVYRRNQNQLDYYHKIHDIVSDDTLLKDIGYTSDTSHDVNEIKVETQRKEFISRQDVYMYIHEEDFDEQLYKNHTPCCIQDHQMIYQSKYGDQVTIHLSDITEIKLDLSAKFLNFGFFSQYVFVNKVDFVSHEGTYKFSVANKDDFIKIINYFKNMDIPITDQRSIMEAYKKYPRDLERQKYYLRTHTDLYNKHKKKR